MPLIVLKTNADMSPEKKNKVAGAISKIVAGATGKPEAYMMAVVEQADAASFAGKSAKVVFADVRAIGGLTQKVNTSISKALCELCKADLDVPQEAVYITFTEVAASNWGWNGKTFG